jgi:hypothetical protein
MIGAGSYKGGAHRMRTVSKDWRVRLPAEHITMDYFATRISAPWILQYHSQTSPDRTK